MNDATLYHVIGRSGMEFTENNNPAAVFDAGRTCQQLRMDRFSELPERVDFAKEEQSVLELWDELDAFQRQLELTKDKPEYTFYDGPPFATGLPHYGHILAGTIKDVVTRYATQTGHYVSRRFGWDCHGLPVEFEIDKKLGITSSDDVFKMGIDKYNAECRSIVTRYTSEWEQIVTRLGRWIDFKKDYKTMEPWYMESVWWVFKTIFEKDLVYRGFKVMPYSIGCTTPLSNFEANLNYKEVQDPAVTVSFPIVDAEDGAALLAWTTTPWTLPSNLALCVHPELTYVKFRDIKSGSVYIVAEELLSTIYPKSSKKGYKGGEFEVIEKMPGAMLAGIRYEPLFDYFRAEFGAAAFRVLTDDYVTADAGTGVVHQAPAFGEDDYRVCAAHAVISKDGELPCPVDSSGRFTAQVTDFVGRNVKEADNDICAALKARGRLFNKATCTHSYPFCWRSETPLIYRAVPSWFVRVETIKEQLLANNDKTYWVPASVKEKRFHNWLRDARDWAISRNRYWGTPLPIWVSDDGLEVRVIGSIAELEEATGTKVTDLHRESIDGLTIPSQQGKGVLHRVPEVFDCWFESGSMPYAQVHYPFENKEAFEDRFPADFIAEGLDQTRGWFYTLMVLSTALFDKPAFKNLIVNGLVLAEDGKKMSKRLKNYPDPIHVVNAYGADALRMYLVNSPVVRAEPLRFKEEGVHGVVRDVLLPWYNACRFLIQNVDRLKQDTGEAFVPNAELARQSSNVMDHWVLAAMHNLIKVVHEEMQAYRLYTVMPALVKFVDQLTNWYVRLNRRRLKGAEGAADSRVALATLYEVLLNMCRLMTPFTPFFTEMIYQYLRKMHPAAAVEGGSDTEVGSARSVHWLEIPTYDASLQDDTVLAAMDALQVVVEAGRVARDVRTISLKTPVAKVIVVHEDAAVLESVRQLEGYVKDELNALELQVTSDERAWCKLRAEADFRALGKRLGADLKQVLPAINALTHDDLTEFRRTGEVVLAGHKLGAGDIQLIREFNGDTKKYEACASPDGSMMVVIDCEQDDTIRGMGLAREVVNRVQKLRKRVGLNVTDVVNVYYSVGEPKQVGNLQPPVIRVVGPDGKPVQGLLATTPLPAAAATDAAAKGKGKGKGKQQQGNKGKGKGKQQGNKSKGGDKPAAAATEAAAPAKPTAEAIADLKNAVANYQHLISKALRTAVVPDCSASRPAYAVVVGTDTSVVDGAGLTITLTLPCVLVSTNLEGCVQSAAGGVTTDAGFVAAVQNAVAMKDPEAVRAASSVSVRLDSARVTLTAGKQLFFDTVAHAKADPAAAKQWKDAGADALLV